MPYLKNEFGHIVFVDDDAYRQHWITEKQDPKTKQIYTEPRIKHTVLPDDHPEVVAFESRIPGTAAASAPEAPIGTEPSAAPVKTTKKSTGKKSTKSKDAASAPEAP